MFSALKLAIATAVVALVGGVLPDQRVYSSSAARPRLPGAATESASPEVAIEDLPPYAAITGQDVRAGSATHSPTMETPDQPPPGTLWHGLGLEPSGSDVDDPRLNGTYLTETRTTESSTATTRFSGSLSQPAIGTVTNDGGS